MLQVCESVSDHFTKLRSKGLRILQWKMRRRICFVIAKLSNEIVTYYSEGILNAACVTNCLFIHFSGIDITYQTSLSSPNSNSDSQLETFFEYTNVKMRMGLEKKFWKLPQNIANKSAARNNYHYVSLISSFKDKNLVARSHVKNESASL